MKSILLALAAILLLGGALTASPLKDEFETRVQAAPSAEDARPIIQEYLLKMSDMDDLRILQNYWMRIDQPVCRDYFEAKHTAEPDNAVNHYLYLRVLDDSYQQYLGSRQLIRKSPDFYWGYRLFSTSYAQLLVNADTPEAEQNEVRKNLQADLQMLLEGSEKYNRDDYLNIALFHHYNTQKDFNKAESYLVLMQEPQAIETNFEAIMNFVEESKRTRAFEALFPKMLSGAIAKGDIAPEDSLSMYQSYYLDALSLAKDWVQMQMYMERNPELKTKDETLTTRIAMHIGLKNFDTALNLLEGAMATDALSYPEVANDDSYAILSTLPRYPEVMALAKNNWEQRKAQRKADALAKKVNKPAPLWELPDKDGNPVKLEDLRGQIVILDFWATWCKPCLKTMPLLDDWYKQNRAKDIAAISVSTWESPSAHDKVLAYMKDSGYSMTLLFGNNELPKAYGFTGIPYICVLDKKGNIAYELNGFSKRLPELLDFWVEDLRK